MQTNGNMQNGLSQYGFYRAIAAAIFSVVVVGAPSTARAQPPGFGAPPFQRMEMRSYGDGSRSDDRSRGDDRSDRDRGDRDKDRDRDRRDSGSDRSSSSYSGSPYSGGPMSSRSNPSSSQATSGSTPASRVRVTLELQSSYADVDSDHDGQIGLYEWKRAKRPLAQFKQLDANNDGFLTPRELERAASTTLIAATPAPSNAPSSSTTPVVTTTPSVATGTTPVMAKPAPTPAGPTIVSTLSDEERSKIDAEQARNFFTKLDTDRDGKVSAAEMATSSRVRPLFEQAGFNFNEPMPADQFVANYVAIQRKAKRT